MSAFAEAFAAHQIGDFARAIELYRASDENPFSTAHNLGVLLASVGQPEAAEQSLRHALELHPQSAEAHYSLSLVLLTLGKLAEGWRCYEPRRLLPRVRLIDPPGDVPAWQGEPLNGRRLLVVGEQGYGDQIFFSRFLPPEAVFACAPPLARLWPDLAPQDTDVWTYAGSLPLLTGELGFLPPRPFDIPLSSGGGIGVVVQGNPAHYNDHNRSLPPEHARRLLGLGRDLRPAATGARDFRGTAEIIAGLDLVISVDTAVAHLAATMGKPTWVLAPLVEPYWPWGMTAKERLGIRLRGWSAHLETGQRHWIAWSAS